MPKRQPQTIWFPELKDILKKRWDSSSTILQHFDLVNELNNTLNQIRTDYNLQPPMMWCPNCQKRERSIFTDVSITAMYYALKRFELLEEQDVKKLLADWKKYSKSENIDIYGKSISDKERENEKHG